MVKYIFYLAKKGSNSKSQTSVSQTITAVLTSQPKFSSSAHADLQLFIHRHGEEDRDRDTMYLATLQVPRVYFFYTLTISSLPTQIVMYICMQITPFYISLAFLLNKSLQIYSLLLIHFRYLSCNINLFKFWQN